MRETTGIPEAGMGYAQEEREQWERDRLLESLEAYRRGLADAPLVSKHAVDGATAHSERGPLTFVVSDEAEDRLGDVIRTSGWELEAYRRNPVFLWAHDYTRTPVGRSAWVGVERAQLLSQVVFAPTAFAREVEALYRQRFLRAVSVGFRAKAFAFRKGGDGAVDGIEFTQQELLEISAVAVPANPQALAKALHGGLEAPRLRTLFMPGPWAAGDAGASGRQREEPTPEEAGQIMEWLKQVRERLI